MSAILAAAGLLGACSSSDHPSMLSSGAGANAAGSSSSNGGNSSSAGGPGFDFGGADGSQSGNGGLLDTCAADVSKAEAVPLDMYIMLDESGSMLSNTATNTTKWAAVKSALNAFLQDPSSSGLGVGLQYFPLQKPNVPASCTSDAECGDGAPCLLHFCRASLGQGGLNPCQTNADCRRNDECIPLARCAADTNYICAEPGSSCGLGDKQQDLGQCVLATTSECTNATSCDQAQYAAPAVPIAALPGAAATLIASIAKQTPAGNTPTAPALGGAIQQASTWAKAHPDHRVVAVLATDGLPTECTPQAIDSVAAIAHAGAIATPPIDTFVIGVFGPDDVAQQAPTNLNKIAKQGNTNSAYIVDTQKDVTAQFVSALDAIRGTHLACEFKIPAPTGNQTLNYLQVNVQFESAGKTSNVYYVEKADLCDAVTGGWYYDKDPTMGDPTSIIACPQTCSAFKAAANGSTVGIALGCRTILK